MIFIFGVISSNVVCYVLFVFHETCANSGINFTKFTPEPDFDGYRCKSNDTIFELKRSNLFSCSKACFEITTCFSVFYQPEFEDCIGCEEFYHTDVVLVGSKYAGRYSGNCYPGWTEGKSYCYYMSAEKTDWNSAMIACERMGGVLLDISEAEQFDDQQDAQYWTDIKYDPIRQLLFRSSGETYSDDYSFDQVDSFDIACIYHSRMTTRTFFPVSCYLPFNFVCKVAN